MIPALQPDAEPSAELAAAAHAADKVVAAALEAVRFGVALDAVISAGTGAARALGIREAVIGAESHRPADALAHPTGSSTPNRILGKASLVTLSVRGWLGGQWLALTRTTVVGYDTLPEQLALANVALKMLVAAGEASCGGVRGGDIVDAAESRSRAALPAGACQVHVFEIEGVAGGRPLSQDARVGLHRVLFVEVAATSEHGTVRLGDLIQAGRANGRPLARLARRLWL